MQLKESQVVGNKSETSFVHSFRKIDPGMNIIYPTKDQDMFEHWDIQINSKKYDVKAIKKLNRSDATGSDDVIWVEIQNVRGDKGWLLGEADYIAFETSKGFSIVSRTALRDLIKSKITDVQGKGYYQRYTRQGRQDLITLVPKDDITPLIERVIYK